MPYRVVELESARNPRVRNIRRAASSGRPTDDGLLVAEGPHLVDELLQSPWAVETVVLTAETLPFWEHRARLAGIETIVLSQKAFAGIAATETTQGVLALARPYRYEWRDLLTPGGIVLVMDGIQDPGNAGTVIRSAEAFGASGVVLLRDCVRISNPKLIRASAGSVFRVPLLESVALPDLFREVRNSGFRLLSLDASGLISVRELSTAGGVALVTGSEGRGLSPEILRRSDAVCIPTVAVESLNAAVACSLALYELSRARGDA
jgi:RNA methyltransferase, TrmH family